MNFESPDHYYMSRALQVAKQGLYISRPNPAVGCVLVKNGEIISEGFTQKAGKAHAEVHAIEHAQTSLENATAYVTLEPCSHTGKTPPCSDALINSGINRVVIATLDPNPLVAGKGVKKLIEAGIDVSVGILEDQAREQLAGFIKRMEHKKPFVRVKMAMSLDGKTAMASGESQWITGSEARADVQKLRARAGVILTGSGTVLDDDPSLNVRFESIYTSLSEKKIAEYQQPLRVVLDTQLKISTEAKMLALQGETLIYTCNENIEQQQALRDAGAEITQVESSTIQLDDVMRYLAAREINEVHVEAGATLSGALLAEQLVDELVIYMAPSILGGDARSLFNLPQLQMMNDKIELEIQDIRAVGKDWKITAVPRYT